MASILARSGLPQRPASSGSAFIAPIATPAASRPPPAPGVERGPGSGLDPRAIRASAFANRRDAKALYLTPAKCLFQREPIPPGHSACCPRAFGPEGKAHPIIGQGSKPVRSPLGRLGAGSAARSLISPISHRTACAFSPAIVVFDRALALHFIVCCFQ
jgi:hypothetical protein